MSLSRCSSAPVLLVSCILVYEKPHVLEPEWYLIMRCRTYPSMALFIWCGRKATETIGNPVLCPPTLHISYYSLCPSTMCAPPLTGASCASQRI